MHITRGNEDNQKMKYNRKNYRQRRDLFLLKNYSRMELFDEYVRRKRRLASKWLGDVRRGTLPNPIRLVLSEFYSQKNNRLK